MANEEKKPIKIKNISIDFGFWEILLICLTLIVIVSMFTGHFDKIINAFK